MRTYYCYQMGMATYPAGEIVVQTTRPKVMRGVYIIRAATVAEARDKYTEQWEADCSIAMQS